MHVTSFAGFPAVRSPQFICSTRYVMLVRLMCLPMHATHPEHKPSATARRHASLCALPCLWGATHELGNVTHREPGWWGVGRVDRELEKEARFKALKKAEFRDKLNLIVAAQAQQLANGAKAGNPTPRSSI